MPKYSPVAHCHPRMDRKSMSRCLQEKAGHLCCVVRFRACPPIPHALWNVSLHQITLPRGISSLSQAGGAQLGATRHNRRRLRQARSECNFRYLRYELLPAKRQVCARMCCFVQQSLAASAPDVSISEDISPPEVRKNCDMRVRRDSRLTQAEPELS